MTPQVSLPSLHGGGSRKSTARRRRARLHALLLATSALASAVLSIAIARADDAVWRDNAASGDFNTATNWSGNTVPDGSTATFGASIQQNISFSQNTTLDGISLLLGAGNYTFTNVHDVAFDGAGLSAGNGASITFNNTVDTNGIGILTFINSSTAGFATINNTNGGLLGFDDFASADHSNINNSSQALFAGKSTAANATITNSELLFFHDKSTAANATITNLGNLSFYEQSTAANATITNHGSIQFYTSSTAGNAFIKGDGTIYFYDASDGGKARIQLDDTGLLDLSFHSSTGIKLGSIEGSGTVFLGSFELKVGGNDRSTTFSGVIQDGGFNGGAGGSLTKEGTGTLTLTGANAYFGATPNASADDG
jgi:acetyltransferase-like isoleucine patch superfamily enzyme